MSEAKRCDACYKLYDPKENINCRPSYRRIPKEDKVE